MKFLLLFAALILVFHSQKAEANNKYLEIQHVVELLQPRIKQATKSALVKKLYSLSEYGMKWEKYLSILRQESSLSLDPKTKGKKCIRRFRKCKDFGIGQVSYFYWGKKLKINRPKALTNAKYSISLSFKVYIHYYKKYAKRDKKWHSRYHSNTPSLRKAYEKRINRHYGKIVVAQKKFRRLLNVKKNNNIQERRGGESR